MTKRPVGYNAPALSITGLQCRHAREYLGLTRDDFCDKSGVGKTTLREFENGKSLIRRETEAKILARFCSYGISFESGLFVDLGNVK
ncbi:helix-turn-helix domain-containing protein [Enterovibrio nigricans]|uniref:helix-turn-helix domain-containing protein n=1 Tax=Enterovibrio nigricans TaxID=504469 RepID=UPI001FCD4A0C|nr:helix-turn-helix transcriptional regulator [Enterovibrio nigricans]